MKMLYGNLYIGQEFTHPAKKGVVLMKIENEKYGTSFGSAPQPFYPLHRVRDGCREQLESDLPLSKTWVEVN